MHSRLSPITAPMTMNRSLAIDGSPSFIAAKKQTVPRSLGNPPSCLSRGGMASRSWHVLTNRSTLRGVGPSSGAIDSSNSKSSAVNAKGLVSGRMLLIRTVSVQAGLPIRPREAELDFLVLQAAPALDPRIRRVYGFLNDDMARQYLTRHSPSGCRTGTTRTTSRRAADARRGWTAPSGRRGHSRRRPAADRSAPAGD